MNKGGRWNPHPPPPPPAATAPTLPREWLRLRCRHILRAGEDTFQTCPVLEHLNPLAPAPSLSLAVGRINFVAELYWTTWQACALLYNALRCFKRLTSNKELP